MASAQIQRCNELGDKIRGEGRPAVPGWQAEWQFLAPTARYLPSVQQWWAARCHLSNQPSLVRRDGVELNTGSGTMTQGITVNINIAVPSLDAALSFYQTVLASRKLRVHSRPCPYLTLGTQAYVSMSEARARKALPAMAKLGAYLIDGLAPERQWRTPLNSVSLRLLSGVRRRG